MPQENKGKSVVYVPVMPEARRKARVRAGQERVRLGAVVEDLAKPQSKGAAS